MRDFLLGSAFTGSIVVALFLGFVVGGGAFGSGDNSNGAAAPTATTVMLADVGTTPEATNTPVDAPPALPNRSDCAEIAGTAFRSESERDFFYANCVELTPTATATVEPVGNAEAVSNPPANNPPPPPSNRFTWESNEGEYLAFGTSLCQSGTAGYTVTGEYAGRSFCTSRSHGGMPPFSCPTGAHAEIKEATAGGQVIGEVFCITPYTPTPAPAGTPVPAASPAP